MISNDLLTRVESSATAWEIGMAGSRSRFDSAMFASEAVRDLAAELRAMPPHREQLARHLEAMVSRDAAPQYRHPKDVAIAVYLRLLDIFVPDRAATVATQVIRLPNIWWSRPLAARLIATDPTRSDSGTSPAHALESDAAETRNGPVPTVPSYPTVRGPAAEISVAFGTKLSGTPFVAPPEGLEFSTGTLRDSS